MILVTGATGHVGNTVVRELLKNGEEVRALVLNDDDSVKFIKELPIEIVYGNLLDYKSLEKAVSGCEKIVHTAGIVSIGNIGNDRIIYDVNVSGLRNLLQAADNAGVRKIVYMSSIHAFNENSNRLEITEETTTDFKDQDCPYARSKSMALEIIAQYKSKGNNIAILYPTGIIGPGDYKEANNALYPIRNFVGSNKKRLFYFEGGYDFVDVRDVAMVTVQLLKSDKISEDYIITGEYISLKNIYSAVLEKEGKLNIVKLVKIPKFIVFSGVWLYHMINKIFRKKSEITPQALRILTSKYAACDNKIKKELNFEPIPIINSIYDSVDFIVEQKK